VGLQRPPLQDRARQELQQAIGDEAEQADRTWGEAGGESHPLTRGGSGEFREWLLCRLFYVAYGLWSLVVHYVALAFARADLLPPLLAAWTANIVFFGIGTSLFVRART